MRIGIHKTPEKLFPLFKKIWNRNVGAEQAVPAYGKTA
jgi:hypothetical protein